MTSNDVIRLAQQVGLQQRTPGEGWDGDLHVAGQDGVSLDVLERFAALVAAQVREECATIAAKQGAEYDDEYAESVCNDCAAAIRATS